MAAPSTGVLEGRAVEVIDREGHVQAYSYHVKPDARVLAVAAGTQNGFFRDVSVRNPLGEELHLRELVAPEPGLFGPTGAVIEYKNLQETNRALERLRFILLLVSLGGSRRRGGGALVSGATLAPVRRLTEAAERIAETASRASGSRGRRQDELARLGTAFNTMLAALEESIETQRRFVADASHELRTPLTSLQTNIEVLTQRDRLDPEQRRRFFADLDREAHEMRGLIGGLLELARGDANLERTTVQLDELVEAARRPGPYALSRIRGNAPSSRRRSRASGPDRAGRLEPARERRQVDGARLERRRHAHRRRAAVRDHGPGFATRTGARLRPLLPLGRGPLDAGFRARPRDRPRGRRGARRHRRRGERPGRRRARAAESRRSCAPRSGREVLTQLLGRFHLVVVRFMLHRTPPGSPASAGRGQPGPASSRIPCGEGAGLSGL